MEQRIQLIEMLAVFVYQGRALVPFRNSISSAKFTVKQDHFRNHSQITKIQKGKDFNIRLSHLEGNLWLEQRQRNYVEVLA